MKKKILVALIGFSLILILAGCSNSYLVLPLNPFQSGEDAKIINVTYNRILIIANIEDYKIRKNVENRIAARLNRMKIKNYQSTKLFSFKKTYKEKDVKTIVNKHQIDGVLVINIENIDDLNKHYFKGRGNKHKNNPEVKLQARIFDPRYSRWTWMWKIDNYQGNYSDFDQLIIDLSDQIIIKLNHDHRI